MFMFQNCICFISIFFSCMVTVADSITSAVFGITATVLLIIASSWYSWHFDSVLYCGLSKLMTVQIHIVTWISQLIPCMIIVQECM